MPPREHACVDCHTSLTFADVDRLKCPECGREYVDDGDRLIVAETGDSVTEVRLARLRDYAEEKGLTA